MVVCVNVSYTTSRQYQAKHISRITLKSDSFLECPPVRVSPTGEVLGNMNNEGAKRMFNCFGSDPQFSQAVCEDGQWTAVNCLGAVFV